VAGRAHALLRVGQQAAADAGALGCRIDVEALELVVVDGRVAHDRAVLIEDADAAAGDVLAPDGTRSLRDGMSSGAMKSP
jgi:hypothetical protein